MAYNGLNKQTDAATEIGRDPVRKAMRTFVCVSFFLFFVFCFLVPLRGTENLHKSTHL